MTPERQAEARRLLAEATPGPWVQEQYLRRFEHAVYQHGAMPPLLVVDGCRPSDAALIAAAPTLLTEALDALAQQREELARHERILANLRQWMSENQGDKYTGQWWLTELDRILAHHQTGASR